MTMMTDSQWEYFVKVGLSLLLGGLVGMERQMAHKPAGLRTNILIVLGSMMFTATSVWMAGIGGQHGDPSRIAANIATGIGFLGAGSIIQTRGSIHGLTTAATIWVNGAIGVSVGIGYYFAAVATAVVTFLVLNIIGHLESTLDLRE